MLRTPLNSLLPLTLLLCALPQSWRSDAQPRSAADQGPSILLPEDATRRTLTLEHLDAVEWSDWEDLPELLADVHARTGIPAIGAAFVRDGERVAAASIGVEAFGSERALGPRAPFMLGSISKSFTATLIGVLVERGDLSWDTTVGEVLGELEMQEAYRDVTIEQLLQHRGGLPAYTQGRPPGHPESVRYSGSPTEQRAAFLADVLRQPPVGRPGRTLLYSNAGYALAGHLAERVRGVAWEQLIRRHIFEPLEMSSAGFGFPDQPRGHVGSGPQFVPVPRDLLPPMEIIAPAGNIHCSVADLARYAAAHLAVAEPGAADPVPGAPGAPAALLRPETLRRLHTPPADDGQLGYAAGWRIGRSARGEPVHWHSGIVSGAYAELRLYPATHSATIVLTTVGSGLGEALATDVGRALRERFEPSLPKLTGLAGFVTEGASPGAASVVKLESTSAEDAQFWGVVRRLSEALNDEDREAFRALFAAEYDLRDADSMFEFMAAGVLPVRGGLRWFHAASAPFRVEGSPRAMRAVTFHLENGFPGYLGLTLDEAGKLVEFSLFVKSDLCRSGTDRRCALSVRELGVDLR